MSFDEFDENELLNSFNVDEDAEDSTEDLPFFNDSFFNFNDYMNEPQYEIISKANSIQEPQKNNESFDSMNSHENSTALADTTNKPEVATQEVTSKGETTIVSGSSSPNTLSYTSKPQGLRVDTALAHSSKLQGLRVDLVASNSINDSDLNRPTSNSEQPATLEVDATNSNAILEHEVGNTVDTAEYRSEEAAPINPDVNGHNDPTSFSQNRNQQSQQEGEAPINLNFSDLDFSFDGLFDSDNWDEDAVDTSGWNLNDWDIEDKAQGTLPLTDHSGSPSAQVNLAQQSNAEPSFNAIGNNVSSIPGTSIEPNVDGLLSNMNSQEEQQASAAQAQSSINQSLHQHSTTQTLQPDIMTTAVTQDIGINTRDIAQQHTTQQPMKSSQTVATKAGTIAGSPKEQVNRNMRMPAQSTSNDHQQRTTQRNVTGTMTNIHLHNTNGHTLQVGQNPSNSHYQQRSKSLPTSEGSSKEAAIDLISPVTATLGDEHATSHAPAGHTPSISRQPVHNSHPFAGPNSHGSFRLQRSLGPAHQPQLQHMTPRSQSRLRHVSVPAQSMGQYRASNGTGYQILSSQMSSSVARPSIEAHQQLGFVASNSGPHSYSQGYGRDGVAERVLSGHGANFTGPKVNDLRAQSLSNDATSSQHRLSHSPRSNLGNHRVLTQEIFQSPQQRQFSLLNQPHALALQHLAPLHSVPRTSVLPNSFGVGYTNSMKHETSSPESASGALAKLKQVPQHDGRRVSQASNFQTPNINLNNPQDQQRIDLLYNAMMDMSDPRDNDGMLKTWRGLMKEKAKIRQVCHNVLHQCYRLEYQGKPLQQAIKSQNTYDGLDSRVQHICEAFESQKTMCKHLMEAPYLYQVVDDPILAANRVVNNRKVNKGKKVAIEAGREALKAVTPHQTGETGSEFGFYGHNDDDDDAEGEDDDDYGRVGQDFLSSVSPRSGLTALSNKRAASNGPTYRAGTPKRTKRLSKYQLNANGEMVEVNIDDTPVRMRQGSQGTPQQQQSRRASVIPYHNAVANNYNYHGAPFNTDYNTLDGIHQGQDQLSGPGGLPNHHSFNYGTILGARLGNGQQDRQ